MEPRPCKSDCEDEDPPKFILYKRITSGPMRRERGEREREQARKTEGSYGECLFREEAVQVLLKKEFSQKKAI